MDSFVGSDITPTLCRLPRLKFIQGQLPPYPRHFSGIKSFYVTFVAIRTLLVSASRECGKRRYQHSDPCHPVKTPRHDSLQRHEVDDHSEVNIRESS